MSNLLLPDKFGALPGALAAAAMLAAYALCQVGRGRRQHWQQWKGISRARLGWWFGTLCKAVGERVVVGHGMGCCFGAGPHNTQAAKQQAHTRTHGLASHL